MPTLGVFEYFQIFRKVEKPAPVKSIFQIVNDLFKSALASATWFLYVTAVLMVATCVYYWYFEKRRVFNTNVQEIQNVMDSEPPKRRPGAVAREREVFRNVLSTAHSYIYPEENNKAFVLRQTRSGTVYGTFSNDRIMKRNSKEKS